MSLITAVITSFLDLWFSLFTSTCLQVDMPGGLPVVTPEGVNGKAYYDVDQSI